MNRHISQRELRNDSAEALRAVNVGEHTIVTSNGVPVAERVPLSRGRFIEIQVALKPSLRRGTSTLSIVGGRL